MYIKSRCVGIFAQFVTELACSVKFVWTLVFGKSDITVNTEPLYLGLPTSELEEFNAVYANFIPPKG